MRFLVFLYFFLSTPVFAAHPCAVGQVFEGRVVPLERSFDFPLQGGNQKFVFDGISMLRQTWNGEQLTLFSADPKPDRYGRISVHAFDDKGWIQQRYLESGAVFVDGNQKAGPCLDALRKAERKGERKNLGLWKRSDLHLRADQLGGLTQKIGGWVLVTGTVLSVGDRDRRLYLNFGQNWRQDFTVVVAKKGRDAFKGSFERLTSLTGKRVRVRGLLQENQGPLIRLVHETQLEILD